LSKDLLLFAGWSIWQDHLTESDLRGTTDGRADLSL
jgi:hypothetical protein